MRGSEPMPWRTASMSAPTWSARLASSFMNEMRVASMALAAYLVNSAERTSILMVSSWLRLKGVYSFFIRSRAFGRAVATDDDAVRPHEVFNGGALFQELGIRHHRELRRVAARGQLLLHGRLDAVRRADRDGRLVDDDFVFGHVLADVAGGGQHVLQIGRAVFVGRRADSDELQTAVRHRGGDVGREMQTAGGAVARHDFFQARLMDRDAAAIEHGDFFLVDVEAENVVTQFGQTGSGHQAYVAGANNRDFHVCLLCSNVF